MKDRLKGSSAPDLQVKIFDDSVPELAQPEPKVPEKSKKKPAKKKKNRKK
jgi:hypothetical protein